MRFDSTALLDSGADISAIPKDLAELSGLPIRMDKIEDSSGIGGRVQSVPTRMTIRIEGKGGRESYTLDIPVNVILDHADFPVLLGRDGIFDQFIITFDESSQSVRLKKISGI